MKPGLQGGRIASAALVAAALCGCLQTDVNGDTIKGRGIGASSSQTGSGASAGTSAGSEAGTAGSGSAGSGTGGGPATGGSGLGSSTGSSSGASVGTGTSTGTPFPDGGYVFCTVPGIPTWLCTPGTYLCDADDAGVCFQCLSDADCADRGRPTYDPKRPHCDLHSGVAGYQNFCQECLASADCANNPRGQLCDISPTYPPNAIEPPILNLGFETCGMLQTDCRVDGGPICKDIENQTCDPDTGRCELLNGLCSTDADCVGYFSEAFSFPLQPLPYCVMGQCSSCLDGTCARSYCSQDADCINPASPAGVAACFASGVCGCLGDLQCSGLWPKCESLDAGYTNDAGLPLGDCGCGQDADCGDAGWICFDGVCGVPCTAPDAPDCSSVPGAPTTLRIALNPICNSSTGRCGPCSSDQECQSDPASGGPLCSDGGLCGCMTDSDCPANQTCQPPPWNEYSPYWPTPVATCVPALIPSCNPNSCGDFFCDWATGECLDAGSSFNSFYEKACLTDYDCSIPSDGSQGFFCDPVAHLCGTCNTDAECAGLLNTSGSHCFKIDAGDSSCGCLSDTDCAGNQAGPACDTTASDRAFHSCGCRKPEDCQPLQTCLTSTGPAFSACGTGCMADSDCQSGYFCDPKDTCRARCEGGPCPAAEPACDSQGGAGQNDETVDGYVAGVVWCYQCLASSECSSLECDSASAPVRRVQA